MPEVLAMVDRGQFDRLPIIRKKDLSANWDDLVEYGDFVDVVSSSGTTGRPVELPVHRQQEQVWVDCVARVLSELGAGPGGKLLQLLSNNDMFSLGPLVWLASKKIGVGPFRCSAQRLQRIADVMNYHRPQFVVGNPMVMLNIADELGADFPPLERRPKYAYFAACAAFDAENALTPMAQRAKDVWGFEEVLNEYGCSELGSIGHECRAHNGFHINDDAVHVELVDPLTGRPSAPGKSGEVVVTALSLPRGFIAVRYGTGDIAAWLDTAPCACGRRSPRLGTIIGRIDHQLKVLGQTVYPDLIFNVVDQLTEIVDSVLVKYRDALQAEQVELWFCSSGRAEQAASTATALLQRHLAVSPPLRSVPLDIIRRVKQDRMARSNGVKLPRYVDLDNVRTYLDGVTS
ncbi:phenylacetate--CoA ligase family protein [Pseudoduganella rivuli]|uniref:phenylacetate--CoA ligase family protein n=1 Tax=Pseudoduganella rivuli TaxID=2666085 RepID=UPI0018A1D034|nr:phenylacetate--CoA ligase family protein [Pseudoduganella rivuli]